MLVLTRIGLLLEGNAIKRHSIKFAAYSLRIQAGLQNDFRNGNAVKRHFDDLACHTLEFRLQIGCADHAVDQSFSGGRARIQRMTTQYPGFRTIETHRERGKNEICFGQTVKGTFEACAVVDDCQSGTQSEGSPGSAAMTAYFYDGNFATET